MTTATAPTGTPPGVNPSLNPSVRPAPITLPLRAMLPGRREGAGILVLAIASLAASATRPRQLPPRAQRGADLVSAVLLLIHPLEVLLLRRTLRRKHDVSPGTRRKLTVTTAVFGVCSTRHALPRLKALSRR